MPETSDRMVLEPLEEKSAAERERELVVAARVSRRGGIISLIGGLVMVVSLAAGAYMFTTETHIVASGGGGQVPDTDMPITEFSGKPAKEEFSALTKKYEEHWNALAKLEDAGTGVIEKWVRLVEPEDITQTSNTPVQYSFELAKGEDLAAKLSDLISAKKLAELNDFNSSVANLKASVQFVESTYPWTEELYPKLSGYYWDWMPDPDDPTYVAFAQSQVEWCRAIGAFETHGAAGDKTPAE